MKKYTFGDKIVKASNVVDALKEYKKTKTKDKLVEANEEIEYVKYKLKQHGFKITAEGRTMSGRHHIEFDFSADENAHVKSLVNMIDNELEKRHTPMTFNVGATHGVIDIDKKYVADSLKDAEEANVDLDFLIKDELEAIDGYRKMIAKTSNPQLFAVLSHILEEELEHVDELRNVQAGNFKVGDSTDKFYD